MSDGWYCVPAKLDAKLTEHLAMGRLFVGLKLRICGARLQVCESFLRHGVLSFSLFLSSSNSSLWMLFSALGEREREKKETEKRKQRGRERQTA